MGRAGVAQLVEHLICNQRVGGSNPFASSTERKAQTGILKRPKVLPALEVFLRAPGLSSAVIPLQAQAPWLPEVLRTGFDALR